MSIDLEKKIFTKAVRDLDMQEQLGVDIDANKLKEVALKCVDEFQSIINKEGLEIQIPENIHERLNYRLTQQYFVDPGEAFSAIRDKNVKRWFSSKKAETSKEDWSYWNAYRTMLIEKGRAKESIAETEKVINTVLDFSGDPNEKGKTGRWSRKGLVMGNVQSGKTENYLGLINKGFDCGYKVVILLGGHINDLRKQTQIRVDEGVIGTTSSPITLKTETLGVGLIRNIGGPFKAVDPYTSVHSDFRKKNQKENRFPLINKENPSVFVVKKNTSVLKSLYEWLIDIHGLHDGELLDLPLLLIDDEADYASINTKQEKEEITKTNELIRKILNVFTRNTYVGYTATPFANIFIDPDTWEDCCEDDLFPEDFMVKMGIPSAYSGQDFYFGDVDLDQPCPVRLINDNEQMLKLGAKGTDLVGERVESLEEAIRAFILVIALRYLREGTIKSHNTMLINISYLNIHQQSIAFLVEQYIVILSESIEAFSSLSMEKGLENSELSKLEKTFDYLYGETPQQFSEIYKSLRVVIKKIEIRSVMSGVDLDYSEFDEVGYSVIAIGGHKLSRGLTLEGLSISYFARTSKGYDTLLQMCRWFGYRPSYEDLCRVYMPPDLLEGYRFITDAIQELYKELDNMSNSQKKPRDFGLKVREHPGVLEITARNKKGTASSRTDYIDIWGRMARRFRFYKDQSINLSNLNILKSFIAKLGKQAFRQEDEKSPYVADDISYEDLITLVEEINLPEDIIWNEVIIDHLRLMSSENLPLGKVAIFNQGQSSDNLWWKNESKLSKSNLQFLRKPYDLGEGVEVNLPLRSLEDDGELFKSPKSHLGNSDDEKHFVPPSKIQATLKRIEENSTKKGKPTNLDFISDKERNYPSITFYLFGLGVGALGVSDEDQKDADVYLGHNEEPSLGFTLTIPRLAEHAGLSEDEMKVIRKKSKHSYWMNKRKQKEVEMGIDDDEV